MEVIYRTIKNQYDVATSQSVLIDNLTNKLRQIKLKQTGIFPIFFLEISKSFLRYNT